MNEMLKILFWNINKKDLQVSISRIASIHQIDIIILIECEISPIEMLKTLNEKNIDFFFASATSNCRKVTFFTRFSEEYIQPIYEESRFTIRKIDLPARMEILLVAIHFPSKINWSSQDQAQFSQRISQEIVNQERRIGHSRTVLVGDFNMNPFEDGMISGMGFNAVESRVIAQTENRIIKEKPYQFFYNPMWNFFGDEQENPPGTFYFRGGGKPIFVHWNIYDQILIRPALLELFSIKNLKIIDSIDEIDLITQYGIPDINIASDHLPIIFSLEI